MFSVMPFSAAPVGRTGLVVIASAVVSLLAPTAVRAQIDSEPPRGIRDVTPRLHALTGARVFVTPTTVLESATIVLRDGRVAAVGADVDAPAGARVWDLSGQIVYPGFIDPMSEIGLPAALKRPPPRRSDAPPEPPPAPPAFAAGYWNPMIKPEIDVAALLDLDDKAVAALRELGITASLAVPRRGVLRGQSAVVLSGDPSKPRSAVLAANVAQHAAGELNTRQDVAEYPTALMGAIALLRQAFYDARWYGDMQAYYAENPSVERAAENSALAALRPVVAGTQRLVYATNDELDYERARAIAAELSLDLVLYGNGHEYRRTAALANLSHPIIVPLEFPEPPDIDSPDGALDVSLEALQHWELAPSNAAYLAQAGIPFAFTADGLENPARELWRNIRATVERGLPASQALAAMTTMPAAVLGLDDVLGTLEPGKLANLVVADADPFVDEDAKLELVFVDGEPFELAAFDAIEPEGRWTIDSPRGGGEWSLSAVDRTGRLTLTVGAETYRGRVDGEALVLLPAASVFAAGEGLVRMTGFVTGERMQGLAELPDGDTFVWSATYAGAVAAADDDGEEPDADIPALVPRPYPAGAFGLSAQPEQPAVLLVRGATVWTSSERGRLDGADVLIRSGRIAAVGPNLEAPRGAVIVDAAGKHVTAGLVDAHSHTAISRGINEAGSAVTVEVRVADVLNPTDINIYRQLAGGLTVANVMHGSANPMGGQTQIIKLRWGGDAADLKLAGAPAGVKFALGENVKQSNWGDRFTTRYPQTRMGVEQIIRDTFAAAARYGEERASASRAAPPLRRDLRLDAALEILNGERAIHVHSYRQDEILAFIRIAEELDLDVAAFQHVLEGYKVGPEIASLGAGGSTFTDWWGYKYEVLDAIPYNAALMHEAGVVVSLNSEDDELATRLNTEAAKAVKYGGLTEEEALAMVTINPAIQLGIEARVGSLEPGKDADFVIWSGHPLSTFTRAEQTWIDGRRYFDLERDATLRETVRAERARLIQKVLAARAQNARQPERGGAGEGSERPTDVYSSTVRSSHAKGADTDANGANHE
jgi:imidazolonepropionase-like amidohydrolase